MNEGKALNILGTTMIVVGVALAKTFLLLIGIPLLVIGLLLD